MKHTWMGLSALVLMTGCPEHEPQALWAQGVTDLDQACKAKAGGGQISGGLSEGWLDISVDRIGYWLNVQVTNNLHLSESTSKLGVANGQLDNNSINLTGATVNYDVDGLGVSLPQGFFQPAAASALPGVSAVVPVNVFPPQVLAVLRKSPVLVGEKPIRDPLIAECLWGVDDNGDRLTDPPTWKSVPLGGRTITVIVRVTYEGVLLDGTEVRSNELHFPVNVCTGCLLPAYASAYQFVDVMNSGTSPSDCSTTPCVIGQDRCVEYANCFNQNFMIDASVADRLTLCANNTAFPPESLKFSLCPPGSSIPCYDKTDKEHSASNLAFRYAFERANAYCTLTQEQSLWPQQ